MMAEARETVRIGLTSAQVEAARRAHGRNEFRAAPRVGFLRRFLANLGDPVIKVLLTALALNVLLLFRTADWFEAAGIAVSVVLATLISTLSEYGSEAAFARLCESCGTALCRVRRGVVQEIPTSEVVVGDVVLLGAGERVPADGRLLSGRLAADQSALTGESREAEKYPQTGRILRNPDSPALLFAGSTVLSGEGEMEVTQVGDKTFLGGISGELHETARESPLKERLTKLAGQISRVGYAAAAVCVLAFLFHRLVADAGFDPALIVSRLRDLPFLASVLLEALTLGLTVVVVAVPEGLPMMIAVVLSSNIRRMVHDRVLVRKPAGLEAAGSMNILFTDKTGTLTRGKLTLSEILTVSGNFRTVGVLHDNAPALFARISAAAHAGGAVRGEREGACAALGGNSTDRAFLTPFLSFPAPEISVCARVPFDSTRKFSAARLSTGTVIVCGAPERLFPRVTDAVDASGVRGRCEKTAFFARVRERMSAGERVILVCEASAMPERAADVPLTLLAALSFTDPLRPEAKEAVAALRGAGVQVVMMTGDGADTAAHVAAACGILGKDGVVMEAAALARLSDAEATALLPRLSVVARALPADKSRLVRLAAAAGLVVGMTGDGINDAPSLRQADVGFSMGSGTQVAKEAGDVVILDDNLASVVRAVLYGRTVFKSIRKFITLQLVMNFCAVGISVIGPFIGFDLPVTVVQMLWINLIMDTLGGLAFAGEAPMRYYLREPPKRRGEPILSRPIVGRIAYLATVTVGLSVFFLKSPWVRAHFRESAGDVCLLTAFFAFFIFASVFNCFNARTERPRMLAGLSRNRSFLFIMGAVAVVQIVFVYLGGTVLRTVPLSPRELGFALALSACVIPLGWLHAVFGRFSRRGDLY